MNDNSSKKQALVTVVIGEAYKAFYDKKFRPSHERFANKYGLDLVVLTERIDTSTYGQERHPSWQKMLVFQSPLLKKYDQICFVDADIYITRHSNNPFHIIPKHFWGMVRNNPYNFEHLTATDLELFKFCPPQNRPDHILNGGFFVADREAHAELFNYVYTKYPEQPCYEQGPLSYEILSRKLKGIELGPQFNCLVPNFLEKHAGESRLKKLFGLTFDNSFIHFCGGIDKKILQAVIVLDTLGTYLLLFNFYKKSITPKRVYEKVRNKLATRKHQKMLAVYQAESDRLVKKYNPEQSLKLHFGCGPRVLKDWINIDLFYEPYEQYLSNYTDSHYPPNIRGTRDDFYAIDIIEIGLPLPDNSVDVVFHEDFIEHLNQRSQIIFLSEIYRVLKPGGIHRINTPELLSSMKNSDFKKGKNGVYVGEWDKHVHLNVLTKKTLEELARMIGYTQINFNEKNKSQSTLIPKEYRPGPDRPIDGNIFADLVK